MGQPARNPVDASPLLLCSLDGLSEGFQGLDRACLSVGTSNWFYHIECHSKTNELAASL